MSSKSTDKKQPNSLEHDVQPGALEMKNVNSSSLRNISYFAGTTRWPVTHEHNFRAHSTINRIMINITFILVLLHLAWPWGL